eukprot:jgi/Chlat1/7108/Chrsp57S06788
MNGGGHGGGDVFEHVGRLVGELTSGEEGQRLEPTAALTQLKQVLRRDDVGGGFAVTAAAFRALRERLRVSHAAVRLHAVLLADHLFARSRAFRALMAAGMDEFLELCVGSRAENPLPPPKQDAHTLRRTALESLERWHEAHGRFYRQVTLAYRYVKDTLRMQVPELRARAQAAERARQEQEARSKVIATGKFHRLKAEYLEQLEAMKANLDEVDRCFELLVPALCGDVDEDDIAWEEATPAMPAADAYSNPEDEDVASAIANTPPSEPLQINIDTSEPIACEGTDNASLFDALRDAYKVMLAHAETLQSWLTVLMKADLEAPMERATKEAMLREVIDTRNRLTKARAKCDDLKVLHADRRQSDKHAIHEDPDKAVLELTSQPEQPDPSAPRASHVERTRSNSGPNSSQQQRPSSSSSDASRGKLLAQAPVVPSGAHLDNWGGVVPVGGRGMDITGHWGRFDLTEALPADHAERSNYHATYYAPSSSNQQQCNAPLKNGRLCTRRDLVRCPFHGPINPRDSHGVPLQSVDDGPNSSTGRPQPDSTDLLRAAVMNVRRREEAVAAASGGRTRTAVDRAYNDAVAGKKRPRLMPKKPAPTARDRIAARMQRPKTGKAAAIDDEGSEAQRTANANRWELKSSATIGINKQV